MIIPTGKYSVKNDLYVAKIQKGGGYLEWRSFKSRWQQNRDSFMARKLLGQPPCGDSPEFTAALLNLKRESREKSEVIRNFPGQINS